MNKEEKVLSMVKKCLKEVETEISSQMENEEINDTLVQLYSFQKDLEKILGQLEKKQLPPRVKRNLGIGYTIIDSWQGNSELGELLLSTEQAYRKL